MCIMLFQGNDLDVLVKVRVLWLHNQQYRKEDFRISEGEFHILENVFPSVGLQSHLLQEKKKKPYVRKQSKQFLMMKCDMILEKKHVMLQGQLQGSGIIITSIS